MPLDIHLKVLWSLLRPQTYFLMCCYVTLGFLFGIVQVGLTVTGDMVQQSLRILYILCALAAWYIAGTAFNDYADFEIDKINLKNDTQRPLVQGFIDEITLLKYAVGASITAIAFAFMTGIKLIGLLYIFLVFLNVAYSLRPLQISRRGGFAHVLLPLGYIVLTISSGYLLTTGKFDTVVFTLIVGMYLHFMSRLVLKDHRDVVGDTAAGKKTLVLKYGNTRVCQLAAILFFVGTLGVLFEIRSFIGPVLPFAILLAGGSLMALQQLAQVDSYSNQRPIISIYGRFCTGIIFILMIGLAGNVLNLNKLKLQFLAIICTVLFVKSIYDILLLQTSRHELNK